MKQYAPLLAAPADLSKISYPVLVSPKLDGIRCIVVKGQPLSRKLKVIPNKFIQSLFNQVASTHIIEGLDGELIVGQPHGEGVFARTSSGVMSHDGTPDFRFYVFDIQGDDGYVGRFWNLYSKLIISIPWLKVLPQKWVYTEEALLEWEKIFLEQGYEGIIIRALHGKYKHGRSTVKEGILLKLVRFATDEATIVDFKEQLHNGNTAECDALGHTKRSSAKAGKRPTGILGSFVVESENYRDRFDVGTGFTAAQRASFWADRKLLRGKLIRFKHKPIGAVDVPRHPVFQGFRSKIDL